MRILKEGGNLVIDGKEAGRIDIRKIDIKAVQKAVGDFAKAINVFFGKKYGHPLWDDKTLKDKKIYSGSGLHLMTARKPDFLMKNKPTFGDVDLQCDETMKDEIVAFLENEVSGKEFGKAKYIGSKRIFASEQIITLWDFEIAGQTLTIQVDFEFVPFENKLPTAFSLFARSSSLEDIEAGIKGVFHKYLLRALTARDMPAGVLLKIKRGKETLEDQDIKQWSFSVARGLRQNYKPIVRKVGDKDVYQEDRNTNRDAYTQDLSTILTNLFGIENPSDKDIQEMGSFLGCMRLIKKSKMSRKQVEDTVLAFTNLLWGKDGQGLFKGEPERDLEEKVIAFSVLCKTLGVTIPIQTVEELVKSFYARYKVY